MSDLGLEILFRDCQQELLKFFRRRVNSSELAADLTQETFLRALRARPESALREPRAYLFRIANNLLTDHYRSAHTRHPGLDLDDAEWQALPDPRPAPEKQILSREDLQVLLDAVDELPPRTRQVFRMHKFDGLSYADISAELGIAKNTVMVHMMKALAHCKQRLDRHRGNDGATQ